MTAFHTVFMAVLSLSAIVGADTCNHNNCERAFNGNAVTSVAQSFCSKFTQAITTATTDIPTYATDACSSSLVSQISSVCSCAYPAPTPISSPKSFITSSSNSTTFVTSLAGSPPSGPMYGLGCNADNCLRAFDRGNGQDFCSSLIAGGPNAPNTLPTYATQCTGSTLSRVSSACTCLNFQPPASSPAVTTTMLEMSSNSSSRSSSSAFNTTMLKTSSKSSSRSSTTKFSPVYPTEGCAADNCLRAMIREGSTGATAFCATFTTAVITAATTLPTYGTMCGPNTVSSLSSACTCLSAGL